MKATWKSLWMIMILLFLLAFCPAMGQAEIVYEGNAYAEDSEYIDLGDAVVTDLDALADFLAQLPNLRRVDMWNNRMTLSQCDMLASRFPNVRWGWTLVIRASDHEHLVRTDYTSFSTLHNNSSTQHTGEDFRILKYCWNLLALDVGHNNVTNLDFLYDLPNLRVLIAACNHLTDITPLASLKNLEYAELFKNDIRDITPLTGLEHLLDLNLCFNHIQDYSPLTTLSALQRLWMYSSRFYNTAPDAAAVAELKAALPDTQIDTTHYSTTGTWRYVKDNVRHPHYDSIVRMFGEDSAHPHYEYVPFPDSFPLEADDSFPSVPDAPIGATVSASAKAEVPPLTLLEPQDFSDRGYLLPIDFSTGSAPKAERYIT